MSVCSQHGSVGALVTLYVKQETPSHAETQKNPLRTGSLNRLHHKTLAVMMSRSFTPNSDLVLRHWINTWLRGSLHNSITRIPGARKHLDKVAGFFTLSSSDWLRGSTNRILFSWGNFLLMMCIELAAFRHMQILRIFLFPPKPFLFGWFAFTLISVFITITLALGYFPPLFTLLSSASWSQYWRWSSHSLWPHLWKQEMETWRAVLAHCTWTLTINWHLPPTSTRIKSCVADIQHPVKGVLGGNQEWGTLCRWWAV